VNGTSAVHCCSIARSRPRQNLILGMNRAAKGNKYAGTENAGYVAHLEEFMGLRIPLKTCSDEHL